jgi:hypothetical protein
MDVAARSSSAFVTPHGNDRETDRTSESPIVEMTMAEFQGSLSLLTD